MTLRMNRTEKQYQDDKHAGLLKSLHDEAPIKEWPYWRLIENRYPHDRHNVTHHLLVLRRSAAFVEITPIEWLELQQIVYELAGDYDYFKMNNPALQSIPGIPHVHFCVLKDDYK